MSAGGARGHAAWLPCLLAAAATGGSGARAQSAPVAQDADAASLAMVELRLESERSFVGQPVRVTVRFGFERELLRERLVSLFRRPLDVPVQVDWSGPGGLELHAANPPAEEGVTVSFGGSVVRARAAGEMLREQGVFREFAYALAFLPEEPGVVTLAAPRMRFAVASGFREDLVRGRVPLDRRDLTVEGAPRTVEVLPLPAEGRPEGFTGAVGRFALRAEVDAVRVRLNEPFALRLHVTGGDPLARWDPPALTDLPGFHVFGRLEEPSPEGRRFRYDLAVTAADVRAVPALEFPYLHPGPPARYRVARSAPIPLTVLGGAAAPPPEDAGGAGGTAGTDGAQPAGSEPAPQAGPPSPWLRILAVAGAAFAAAWLLAALRRRRSADRAAPPAAAGAAAGAASGPPPAGAAADEESALHARLGRPPALMDPAELSAALRGLDMTEEQARRTAAALHRAVAERYGAPPGDGEKGAARSSPG